MRKICPECGYGNYVDSDVCEECNTDISEVEPEYDEVADDMLRENMEEFANNANDAQDFYKVYLEPGYYSGIQFCVDDKYEDIDSWDDEDSYIQFGTNTKQEAIELKQKSKEIVLKILNQAKKNLGLIELKVSARFSNGETMYDKVDEHSSVTCDGCGMEVHDDTVEVVGDKVLCDRCRNN